MNNKPSNRPAPQGEEPKGNTAAAVGIKSAKIAFFTVKKVITTALTLIATVVMMGIITGCIVGCVLTVYVLQGIGSEEPINLDNYKLGYTSIIYAYDKSGQPYELQRLYNPDNNRIWVDYDQISTYVIDALVATEDKRFYEHQGVDWIRTAGAGLSLFGLADSGGGGSTIHQQLIKNITGDDDIRIDRKVQEIFRALRLAKDYSREQVLETYLNVVPFGAGTNGIESAAKTYFNKSAKDLSLPEAAAIVGITKYPGAYNPLLYPDANKKRQEDVLTFMWKQSYITEKEYEDALVAPLNFYRKTQDEGNKISQSYFIDHVVFSIIDEFMDKYDMTWQEAKTELYEGGYRIYTTVDMDIQNHLEEFYSTYKNFPEIAKEEYPQSACVITDLNGKILGLVGGIGEKEGALVFNRATMAKRQPGSTFKPIGPYALGIEYNRVTWSTIIEDSPINPEDPQSAWYPKNYYQSYRGNMTVRTALASSVNTVAVKTAQIVGVRQIFDFLHNDLGLTSLVEFRDGYSDVDIAPMALGGVTDGITPLEMAGAYQMIGNGGYYTKPYAYTKVENSEGRIILEADTVPRRVIGEDTSVVLNKLLQEVVYGDGGTGTRAAIPNMPTAGKTGTSNSDVDQWFIGMTPYYLCQVWLGYDTPKTYDRYGNEVVNSVLYNPWPYPTPPLFNLIMAPLHEDLEAKSFLESENVTQQRYCTVTGNLAGPDCPSAAGWYKTSRIPTACNGVHIDPNAKKEEETSGTGSGTGTESETQTTPEAPVVSANPSGDGADGDVNPAPAA
ncbi:MAG: transglycosylase domain-containing protein [Oscillospiraceae bacterium]